MPQVSQVFQVPQAFHDRLSAGLQHRRPPPDNRQQQQDNGTHEFQPSLQHGDAGSGSDPAHTLSAHLERSRTRGELPRVLARPPLRLARS